MSTYFIYATLFWLICGAIYYCFLRRETMFRANRYYLLTTLLLGLGWPVWSPLLTELASSNSVLTVVQEVVVITPNALPQLPAHTFSVWPYIVFTYWFITAIIAVRFLWQLFALVRSISFARRHWKAGICEVFAPQITQPGSWFCFFFVPSNQATASCPTEVRLHEHAHIRQGHSWDILVLELSGIFFWWNPLWYLYNRSLRQVHEYLADASVLQRIPTRQYAELLVQYARQTPVTNLVSTFHTSSLKQRIIMMTKQSSSRAIWKYVLILPVLIFLTLTCVEAVDDHAITSIEHPNQILTDSIYEEVDQMPVFGDCAGLKGESLSNCSHQNLLQFIFTNLKYPKEARKKDIEGTSLIELVITKTGKVTDVKTIVKEGLSHPILDDEALRVIKALPDFTPGHQDGKSVNVRMVIPLKFKLE